MIKYKTLTELLVDFDEALNWLSYKFNIRGMTQRDIKQELNLLIIKLWKKKDCTDKGLGWWFLRCKWHLLNMVKKSNRKPLNQTISLNKFFEDSDK